MRTSSSQFYSREQGDRVVDWILNNFAPEYLTCADNIRHDPLISLPVFPQSPCGAHALTVRRKRGDCIVSVRVSSPTGNIPTQADAEILRTVYSIYREKMSRGSEISNKVEIDNCNNGSFSDNIYMKENIFTSLIKVFNTSIFFNVREKSISNHIGFGFISQYDRVSGAGLYDEGRILLTINKVFLDAICSRGSRIA